MSALRVLAVAAVFVWVSVLLVHGLHTLFVGGMAMAVWLGYRHDLRSIWALRQDLSDRFDARHVALVGMVILLLGVAVAPASAAFLGTTQDIGNTLSADTLDPPTGLSATAIGSDVRLDWTATPDLYAAGYSIYRSATQGCCYAYLDSVVGQATTTYLDVGALGASYYYVVEAHYQNWTSVYSNEATSPQPPSRVELANSWTTGLTHVAGTGNGRLLVLVVGMENRGDRDLTTVSYGGRVMTQANERVICSVTVYCVRSEVWYLNEAGIRAATGTSFTVTWSGTADLFEPYYSAVTLRNVNQVTPIGDTSSNGTETANPIQVAAALNVTAGDLVLVGATSGNPGSYTPSAGYTEGTDQALASSTSATAYRAIVSTGTQQPSMTFDAAINRQVITGTVIKRG
jgi:hypothetical protein